MTTKAASTNSLGKLDMKYRDLIDDCLRQLKEVQKVLRRVEAYWEMWASPKTSRTGRE